MSDDNYQINLFNYRELTADFIDQFANELADRGNPKLADSVLDAVNEIKEKSFSRVAAADELITWHRDMVKGNPVYHEFVSRGYFFLMAHVFAGERGDAYAAMRTALAQSVSLAYVPDNMEIHHQSRAMTYESWLKDVLLPSTMLRFMVFVLLVQLTAVNQGIEPEPAPSGEANVNG